MLSLIILTRVLRSKIAKGYLEREISTVSRLRRLPPCCESKCRWLYRMREALQSHFSIHGALRDDDVLDLPSPRPARMEGLTESRHGDAGRGVIQYHCPGPRHCLSSHSVMEGTSGEDRYDTCLSLCAVRNRLRGWVGDG
jgi:hypothetical protein